MNHSKSTQSSIYQQEHFCFARVTKSMLISLPARSCKTSHPPHMKIKHTKTTKVLLTNPRPHLARNGAPGETIRLWFQAVDLVENRGKNINNRACSGRRPWLSSWCDRWSASVIHAKGRQGMPKVAWLTLSICDMSKCFVAAHLESTMHDRVQKIDTEPMEVWDASGENSGFESSEMHHDRSII